MSAVSLDLIDAELYEARQADNWTEVLQLYAQGWRCIAAYSHGDGAVYVLERRRQ